MIFIRRRAREIADELGYEPSMSQKLIIEHLVNVEWQLRKLQSENEHSSHDMLRACRLAEKAIQADLQLLGIDMAHDAAADRWWQSLRWGDG